MCLHNSLYRQSHDWTAIISLVLFYQLFTGGAAFHWRGPECNCPIEEVGHSCEQTVHQNVPQLTSGKRRYHVDCYCCKNKTTINDELIDQ
jgi:hypothetical protein